MAKQTALNDNDFGYSFGTFIDDFFKSRPDLNVNYFNLKRSDLLKLYPEHFSKDVLSAGFSYDSRKYLSQASEEEIDGFCFIPKSEKKNVNFDWSCGSPVDISACGFYIFGDVEFAILDTVRCLRDQCNHGSFYFTPGQIAMFIKESNRYDGYWPRDIIDHFLVEEMTGQAFQCHGTIKQTDWQTTLPLLPCARIQLGKTVIYRWERLPYGFQESLFDGPPTGLLEVIGR